MRDRPGLLGLAAVLVCCAVLGVIGTNVESTISTPPIVGVPFFFWCACGPSSRMYCPICISRSFLISHGPNTNARNIAVKLAYTVRTVMYRKTLSGLKYRCSHW